VDPEELREPRVLDMKFIRDFMLVIGSISSAFDFLTFYVMLAVLRADEKPFQTGWFVESLCTQMLVIFIIRTRGNPFMSRPHPVLAATSLAVAALGAVRPFTHSGTYLGDRRSSACRRARSSLAAFTPASSAWRQRLIRFVEQTLHPRAVMDRAHSSERVAGTFGIGASGGLLALR
jgi:magnesium-transporting ATPase (P-type)